MAQRTKKTFTMTAPTRLAGAQLPQSHAKRADRLYTQDKAILAFGKKIKEAEAAMKELRAQLEDECKRLAGEMRRDGAKLVRGQTGTFSYNSSVPIFSAENWEEFYAYIRKNDAFELLERRPARAGLVELQDKGTVVPGIKYDTKQTYSLTKAGGK